MLAAVSMWHNEADIGPTVLRHLLAEGVDLIIVADNLSTDGTRDHLEDFAKHAPVVVIDDPEPAYFQSAKMTRLVHMAGQRGADWIVAFDADEVWYSPRGRLADVLRNSPHGLHWVEGMYHIPHEDDDQSESDPVRRMVHRRAGRDCPQSKVCFRYRPSIRLSQGNHRTEGHKGSTGSGVVAFREFQYRSFEHFVSKVRHGKMAYDAGGVALHEDLGIHWRRLGALSDAELEIEWKDYLATPTVYDPAPLKTTEVVDSTQGR